MNWQQILPVLVVAAVVAFFVLRGSSKKSCGCGHSHDHPPEKENETPPSV